MKAKNAIHKLGEQFDIEVPHTRHVTRLAMELFDGFSPMAGLRKGDKNLLFAAASLHDIAYATDPQQHVLEGARLLAEHRIETFDPDEWLAIIGIVLLHKRDWRSVLDHDAFPVVSEKEMKRIKKLAAILRIADGLDHGHIQDARITYCKRGERADKVGVECAWYAGNIPWAEGKADLWEAIYKRPFRFDGNVRAGKKRFKGVVHKKDTVVSAARRILYSQWSVMRDQLPRMHEGHDPEDLHRYRTALRRFRTALRLFHPLLSETSGPEFDLRLRQVSDELSPVREAHVALLIWQSLSPEASRNSHVAERLEADAVAAHRKLKSILESEVHQEMVPMANRLLRIELPRLERLQRGPAFPRFVQKRLEQACTKMKKIDVEALRTAEPARLHKARKAFRRGHYYAEFAAPVSGGDTQQAAERLKTMAGVLGDIRDIRTLNDKLDDPDIVTALARAEHDAWARFLKVWNKFTIR